VSSFSTLVVDSSAIVAMLRDEPDAVELATRAAKYARRVMSAATWLESAIVCESKSLRGGEYFDEIAAKLGIEVLPFTLTQAQFAREAFKRYGKGRQTKAQLSYGDCFVYALAKELGAPVLFKGSDFAQTDIEPA
jgi:ribonuclease VapC